MPSLVWSRIERLSHRRMFYFQDHASGNLGDPLHTVPNFILEFTLEVDKGKSVGLGRVSGRFGAVRGSPLVTDG